MSQFEFIVNTIRSNPEMILLVVETGLHCGYCRHIPYHRRARGGPLLSNRLIVRHPQQFLSSAETNAIAGDIYVLVTRVS